MFKRITLTESEKSKVNNKVTDLISRLAFLKDADEDMNSVFETIAIFGKAVKKFSKNQVNLTDRHIKRYYIDMKEQLEKWCVKNDIELTHIVANNKYIQAIFKDSKFNNGFTFTVFETELA